MNQITMTLIEKRLAIAYGTGFELAFRYENRRFDTHAWDADFRLVCSPELAAEYHVGERYAVPLPVSVAV